MLTAAANLLPPRWAVRLYPNHPLLRLVALLLFLLLALPLLALIGGVLAVKSDTFLSAASLAHMLVQTVYYVGGVLLLSVIFALPTAWAVVMLEFRGRQLATWLLLLPFALPPYLTAFVYHDLLREFGIYLNGDLLAVTTTALALYPYVFFLARAALRQQHFYIHSAARLLGCSALATVFRVSLPLARPAIGVGIALVAMEALNDIAVAQLFGIQTLGAGIYDLWLNRRDMIAGIIIALALTGIVFLLVWAEEFARRRQAQYVCTCDKCFQYEHALPITGGKLAALWSLLLLPVLAGFLLPVGYLMYLSLGAPVAEWRAPLMAGLSGSLSLALALVSLLLVVALVVALDKRLNTRGAVMRLLSRLARVIYALPGTVIAQGIFLLSLGLYAVSGWRLVAVGGMALLLLACSTRFFVIASGALENAMDKISPQLDAAARLAAVSPLRALFIVYLPQLRPAAAVAAVMILLEGIKELPMTLILRPFNFDTLATIVYQYASDESLRLAAPSALLLALLAAAAITLLFQLEGKETKQQLSR